MTTVINFDEEETHPITESEFKKHIREHGSKSWKNTDVVLTEDGDVLFHIVLGGNHYLAYVTQAFARVRSWEKQEQTSTKTEVWRWIRTRGRASYIKKRED